MDPGSFPLTGLNESNRASYFALSAGVTAQLYDLERLPVGEDIRDPSEVVEAMDDVFWITAGGCSPLKNSILI